VAHRRHLERKLAQLTAPNAVQQPDEYDTGDYGNDGNADDGNGDYWQ
jgi:hypothetical protein